MKKKCRILSVCVVVACVVISAIAVVKALNKDEKYVVYAESVSFTTSVGGFEMCIDNQLLIDESIITISPSDCSFKPEFVIKCSSAEDKNIKMGKYTFASKGNYILECKVKSGKDYYAKDTIKITVVDSPTTTTNIHIDKLPMQTIYIDDEISLTSLAGLDYPTLSTINIECSEHVAYSEGKFKALYDGIATINISITYDYITICETVSLVVKVPIAESGVDLILSVNNNILTINQLQITYSPFNFTINYKLTNPEHNQVIDCWTDSEHIKVVSFNAPSIILTPLSIGEAIVYVSPIDYPHIMFEIVITIV